MEDKNYNYKELLLNASLNVLGEAQSLKQLAYAQIVFFVLCDKSLNIDMLTVSVAKKINKQSVPQQSIVEALKYLQLYNAVAQINTGFWEVSNEHKDKLHINIERNRADNINICLKRFPKSIKISKVSEWFDDANEACFSLFADELLKSYRQGDKPAIYIDGVIEPVIKVHDLGNYQAELLQGYNEFLKSNDKVEEARIKQLMQSLLFAKMIAADISPDVWALDRYKNAHVFLDTNVLFASVLCTKNVELNRAMKDIGRILKNLGCKFYITDDTVDEYESVLLRARGEATDLWSNYSVEVLKKSKRDNDFFRSLIECDCKSVCDVNTFFDELERKKFTFVKEKTIRVKKEIYKKYNFNQKNDQKLYDQVKESWENMHGQDDPKPNLTVIHDLLLTKLARKVKSDRKNVFVLTLDKSMEHLALQWVNEKEDPLWLSVYSLIKILAINGGGASYDFRDIAALVRAFMTQEEIEGVFEYDTRDLLLLPHFTDRISELDETKVKDLLNKIHRGKMSHHSEEQMSQDIRVEVERTLRTKEHSANVRLQELESKVTQLEDKNNSLVNNSKKAEATILWGKFGIKVFVGVAFFLILLWFVGGQFRIYISQENVFYINIMQYCLFILAPLLWIWRCWVQTNSDITKLKEKYNQS